MIGPPLLPCLAGAIVDDQYPVAIHPLDDGFGYCRPRTDRAYTTDLFEQGTQGGPQRMIDCRGWDLPAHCIPGYSGTFTDNDDFPQCRHFRRKTYRIGVLSFKHILQGYILRFIPQTLYKDCIRGIP